MKKTLRRRNYETISVARNAMRKFTRENSTFIARKSFNFQANHFFALIGRHFPPHTIQLFFFLFLHQFHREVARATIKTAAMSARRPPEKRARFADETSFPMVRETFN